MPRTPADYRATDHIAKGPDAYIGPAFSKSNRARRFLWHIVWTLFYRFSWRPLHSWRAFLLRLFGAQLGPHCHFYPKSKIWAPWNLICDDHVAVADDAEIYNPSTITLDSHVILSQGAYLCGATHDYDDPAFPLLAYTMHLAPYAWVCARACVAPGVSLGEGAVLGLNSVATRNLDPWTIYAGNPAIALKPRHRPTTADGSTTGRAVEAVELPDKPFGFVGAGLQPRHQVPQKEGASAPEGKVSGDLP